MLKACASSCADFLMRHTNIASSRRPIYLYGFELLLSTLTSALSILFVSVLFNSIEDGAIFLVIYIGLRVFCGGYHAKTHELCFISSNFTFFVAWIFTKVLTILNLQSLATVLVVLSTIVILILAPIRNKNHPLSDKAYKKNRKIAIIFVSILFIIYLCLAFLNCPLRFFAVFTSSISAVAVLMVIPKLLERRENHG